MARWCSRALRLVPALAQRPDVVDHDTSTAIGAFPYEGAVGDQDPFAVIGQLALDAACGVRGLVGNAESHLFPAGPLVRFGVEWLSREFGS